MKIFCNLSGIHPYFPFEEIKGILEAESISYKIIEKFRNYIILEIKNDNYQPILDRAAFCKGVYNFLFQSPLEINAIKNNIESINISKIISDKTTFAVRINKFKSKLKQQNIPFNSEQLESIIGELILKCSEKPLKVNLNSPQLIFNGFRFQNKLILGVELGRIYTKTFEKRSGPKKPYFHPCGLDPKFSRLMVNIARIKRGSILYDPHCGIGSILIEAGLVGYRVIGSDISWKMINGSRINLKHFRIHKSEIFRADSRSLPFKNIDHIVSDPPYGRSSPLEGNSIIDLYDKFLNQSKNIIKKDHRIVFASPQRIAKEIKSILLDNNFQIEKKFDYYMHRSLIRNLWIIKIK